MATQYIAEFVATFLLINFPVVALVISVSEFISPSFGSNLSTTTPKDSQRPQRGVQEAGRPSLVQENHTNCLLREGKPKPAKDRVTFRAARAEAARPISIARVTVENLRRLLIVQSAMRGTFISVLIRAMLESASF
jgi:hypothetical protein